MNSRMKRLLSSNKDGIKEASSQDQTAVAHEDNSRQSQVVGETAKANLFPPLRRGISKSISYPQNLTISTDLLQPKDLAKDNSSVNKKEYSTNNRNNSQSKYESSKKLDSPTVKPLAKVSQETTKDENQNPNTLEINDCGSSNKLLEDFTYDNWQPRFKIEPHAHLTNRKHRFPRDSLYRADFVPFKNTSPTASFKPSHSNALKTLTPIDFKTTNLIDYRDWNSPPPERYKDPARIILDIPFVAGTAYKNEFVNWGPNAKVFEPPKQPSTIIPNLPLRGKSIYAESFIPQTQAKRESPIIFQNKSPLSFSLPFVAKSTYNNSYASPQLDAIGKNSSSAKLLPSVSLISGGGSYKGNYKTVFSEQYVDPVQRVYVGPRNN